MKGGVPITYVHKIGRMGLKKFDKKTFWRQQCYFYDKIRNINSWIYKITVNLTS